MGKATIRSIAKKLNIAPATVHRALSGCGSVALSTRRRIIRCANESGYILPERNSRNIAVLVPHFRFYGYMTPMLSALENVLHEHHYHLQLIPEADIDVLGDHMFDGIISMVWQEGKVLTLPREYPIPIVSLNSAFSVSENISLVASAKHGILLALNYLKHHNCRRVFFVGTLTEKNPIALERLADFRQFCLENSLDFDRMHRSVAAAEVESVLPDILSAGADGVFCASETFASRLGKAMLKHGIAIPEDISLMGMEDEELNTAFSPPITAIRQDFEKLAQCTVEVLIQAIEKRIPVKNIRVPYTLIERASVRKKD